MKKIIFSEQEIQEIIQLYKDNNSQQKIADKFKVSRKVIKRILDTNFETPLREKTSTYMYQQNIFEEIDTTEKAYWLGFLAADGCNYQRRTNASIILNINQKDIKHLQKFKDFCGTNAKIKEYIAKEGYSKDTSMCKIVINSKKISNDLIDKGVVPSKSLILQPPKIPEKFYKSFILGYFDGDGSIYKTKQCNNYVIRFEGTKEMLIWISSTLGWNPKLEKRYLNSNKNNYYIRCGGTKKPYELLKQLYDSCETHLERKFLLYKSLETVVINS